MTTIIQQPSTLIVQGRMGGRGILKILVVWNVYVRGQNLVAFTLKEDNIGSGKTGHSFLLNIALGPPCLEFRKLTVKRDNKLNLPRRFRGRSPP